MSKTIPQFTFEFTGEGEEPKEFLSGQPIPAPERAAPKSSRGRKALKDIESDAENVHIPEDEILFQKQYYSIGEVASMFHVNTSLIRYWENEFDILEPRKNRKGDRFFKPEDVKNLQLIYDLLRRRKFTLEGAKDYLKSGRKAKEKYEMIQSLQKLRSFLLELKASL
jgi:DNA-binding transcriptional MerR regulator